jgi:lipid II:glycine glycyltransferase (peptidoglycan interpeptide bridge formation enzyme)
MVNLDGTEEDILNRMKQKTRYNIRLAEKRDVKVRISSNVEEFHHLALQTAERDAFGIHTLDYYEKIYQLFHPAGQCELLTAYFNDQPLASLFVMVQGKYSFYMYGASSDLERNRMPTYLIQWEAMKWAKTKNCQWYDLWGIPDMDDEELEESFLTKHAHDGLWGVYRFKRGFGGEIWRSAGAWDRIYNSPMYWLYQQYTKLRGGGEG